MISAMDMIQAAWVAGYLEGEGSFLASPQGGRYYLRIQAHSTDLDTLELLLGAAGGLISGPYNRPDRKPFWAWNLNGGRCREIFYDIYPYMSKRRQQQIINALWHAKHQLV